jgi:phosphate transport system permease protein
MRVVSQPRDLTRPLRRRAAERVAHASFFACALMATLVLLGLVVVLARETIGFFSRVSAFDFFGGTEWTPLFVDRHFGVLPLLVGSIQVVLGAALVALPVGLLCGIYLSEYAGDRTRQALKSMLEILAGVPTVVYGYFALTFVTPLLRVFFPDVEIFNMASASLVVGIMIIPMVASLAEDALRAVPDSLRDAAFALGATRAEVALRIVVPGALSGILASFVLAMSRAMGETMIVTIAAGNTPRLTGNPLEPIQTMSAYLAQVGLGDPLSGTLESGALFAVGATLFAITLSMNWLAQAVLTRFRERYQ